MNDSEENDGCGMWKPLSEAPADIQKCLVEYGTPRIGGWCYVLFPRTHCLDWFVAHYDQTTEVWDQYFKVPAIGV
jgi:hypothetical protein